MAPGKYNNSRLIARIARECGLSVSCVYGILNGDAGFSASHRVMVEELAHTYGLSTSPQPQDHADITLGIIIPKLPGYFWNEAIAGIKNAIASYRASGVRIKPVFRYFSPNLFENADERLIAGLRETPCDGYILYPLLRDQLWQFFATLDESTPIVVFNDYFSIEEQKRYFRARLRCAYVGADSYAEGRQAAAVMRPHISDGNHLLALVIGPAEYLSAGLSRVQSFVTQIQTDAPHVQVESLPIEVTKKTSAALLAGELESRLLAHRLDGVYVSAGFTHIAAAAIRKICRRHGINELTIPCVGHEISPSDKPYLADGILRGYVRQDIYCQGRVAVRQIIENLLSDAPMRDAIVRSSLYVKDLQAYGSLPYVKSAISHAGHPPQPDQLHAGRSKIAILPGGVYEVSGLLGHTDKTPPVSPPKPPKSAQYIRRSQNGLGADGVVKITAPDGLKPTSYRLSWANAVGPLSNTSATVHIPYLGEEITVYPIPEGTLLPLNADRILIWSINDSPVTLQPTAAVIVGATRRMSTHP